MQQDEVFGPSALRAPSLRRTDTLGVLVDAAASLEQVVALINESLVSRHRLLVTFVNPSAHAIVRRNPEFRRLLELFNAVLPDGIGMSVAMRWLHRLPATRISFDMTSLAPPVLNLAASCGHRVVLIGGAPGCAERAAARLCEIFPGLQVAGVFDGYGDLAERAAQVAAIDPPIVICGMGTGAQEAMLMALVKAGWGGCGFTCGGFLNQVSERAAYYPAWVDRLQVRWAYRLAKEPRRLWRRYLLTYPPFVVALFAGALRNTLYSLKGPTAVSAAVPKAPLDDAFGRGTG